ncbi:MAG: glycosyltransferase family 2 protein [Bernardetiaceae bacterium]|nr:glycosyltransferase family 2 protein [Bernardetiaceae bacterium]
MPLISVLISTYNRADLLKRSLHSLLLQTYTNYELIVIDDGSTDHTFSIINPYLSRFKDFTYIKHSNRRSPMALNTGLRLAASKYITFLDSDDEYLPEHLEKRISYMEAHQHIDIVYGGLEIIGNPYVRDKDNLEQWIPIEDCVPCATIFARRQVFEVLNGFRDLKYAHDTDFVERARANAFHIQKVDYPTYKYYRDSPDSVCNQAKDSLR